MFGQLAGCGWSVRMAVFGVPRGRTHKAWTTSGAGPSFLKT
jgi:hypothetical protein